MFLRCLDNNFQNHKYSYIRMSRPKQKGDIYIVKLNASYDSRSLPYKIPFLMIDLSCLFINNFRYNNEIFIDSLMHHIQIKVNCLAR